MKLFYAIFTLFFSTSLFASNASLLVLPEELETIESKTVGDVEVLVLEEFLQFSIKPAVVLAVDENSLLIERDGKIALLVTRKIFDNAGENPFIMFNTCREACGGAAIAGALTGAVGGASQGAQTGALMTGGTPQGAAGGAVIGGTVGAVGGGMGAYEVCKIASECDQVKGGGMDKVPDPEK